MSNFGVGMQPVTPPGGVARGIAERQSNWAVAAKVDQNDAAIRFGSAAGRVLFRVGPITRRGATAHSLPDTTPRN
jgi:hypothetical protein